MQATRLTGFAREEGVFATDAATLQQTCWRDTTYTAVNWNYPPSPASYYDALLSRGASHSRFLRIAYLSTRRRLSMLAPPSPTLTLSPTSTAGSLDTSTTPTSPSTPAYLRPTISPDGSPRNPPARLPSVPLHPSLRQCMNMKPRSTNPTSPVLKRRKPQWPKPPHYHASLLRSPLSRRRGLFREILPPNQAIDFFRWDIFLGAEMSLSTPCQERDRDPCVSLLIAESVLESYEAAAGFFGWHGLGLDVVRCVEWSDDEGVDDECCWGGRPEERGLSRERDGIRVSNLPDLQLEVDEAVVEEGRTRWTRMAEKLVGPPGLSLRGVLGHGRSGKVIAPLASAHKDVADSPVSSSMSSGHEGVRWELDNNSSPCRLSRPTSTSDEKRPSPPSRSTITVPDSSSSCKPEHKPDSSSVWWYGPSPCCGLPPTLHLPSLRFSPLLSAQYGPPPLQFSPWFPPGRVTSAQGHGYWYGVQPSGVPSVNHDPNLPNSLPLHSHVLASPVSPTSTHPSQSSRCPIKPGSDRDEYGSGHDCDKEIETDHGYESTTTTTDSDPLPHTPIGAATASHWVEALQAHGDDEVEVHGIRTDTKHAAASVSIGLSDPTTPIKLLDRFSVSTSPSMPSGLPNPSQVNYGSSKAAVVFPSLNGSFRQGSSSQMSVTLSSRGISTHTTPTRAVTSVSLSSSVTESAAWISLGDEDNSKVKLQSADAQPVFGDGPAFTLSPCSPPTTSPRSGLRKDSQGFWEPVTPISPSSSSSSSSSSLPLSSSKLTAGWIGEDTGPVLGESLESSEAADSFYTVSGKSKSLSPSPRHVTSTTSAHSSSSRPASFSSPMSTPASVSVFDGSYPSSPSPTNSSSSNPTSLLPAFLASPTVKRKKTSRTREIVDRLRSSSLDAGKQGVALDNLGWLAGPSAGGDIGGTLGKGPPELDHVTRNDVPGGQLLPSPSTKSRLESTSWLESDPGKDDGQTPSPKSADPDAFGSGGKSNEMPQTAVPDRKTLLSPASAKKVTTTVNPSITPFPILAVPQSLASDFTTTRQTQSGGTTGCELVTTTPSSGGDRYETNGIIVLSPNARGSSTQLPPSTPNGCISPSTHHSHHSPPSPARSQSSLGPPPSVYTISPYPHAMYAPFTQYHLAPSQQGQLGQGTWLAVYPGRPSHVPVHSLPVQTRVSPITGMSGMRHISW